MSIRQRYRLRINTRKRRLKIRGDASRINCYSSAAASHGMIWNQTYAGRAISHALSKLSNSHENIWFDCNNRLYTRPTRTYLLYHRSSISSASNLRLAKCEASRKM